MLKCGPRNSKFLTDVTVYRASIVGKQTDPWGCDAAPATLIIFNYLSPSEIHLISRMLIHKSLSSMSSCGFSLHSCSKPRDFLNTSKIDLQSKTTISTFPTLKSSPSLCNSVYIVFVRENIITIDYFPHLLGASTGHANSSHSPYF